MMKVDYEVHKSKISFDINIHCLPLSNQLNRFRTADKLGHHTNLNIHNHCLPITINMNPVAQAKCAARNNQLKQSYDE